MFRKMCRLRRLCSRSERICSGMGAPAADSHDAGRTLNGYAPEKVAAERICSGIRGKSGAGTGYFAVLLVVIPQNI